MTVEQVVRRINSLTKGLCGADFSFLGLIEAGPEWRISDLAELSGAGPFPRYIENENGRYAFPLVIRSQCKGLLVLSGFTDTRSNQLIVIRELIDLVCFEANYQEKSEARVEEVPQQQVLSFDQFRQRNDADSSVEVIDIESILKSLDEATNPLRFSNPLMFQLPSGVNFQNIARDLHDRTGAWAMFNLEDLSSEVFDSASGLKDLGQVTMFVSDFERLTTNQQIRLAEQLSDPKNTLQVIAVKTNRDSSSQLAEHLMDLFVCIDLTGVLKKGEPLTVGLVIDHINKASVRIPPGDSARESMDATDSGKKGRLISLFSNPENPTLH